MAVEQVGEARREEGGFTGARGVRIFHQSWIPDQAPTAAIVIAHGFAEHGGRYTYVAGRLVRSGYAVRVADHRGHGRSDGKRTSVVRFSDYVADLHAVVGMSREQWPSVPLVVLGHSMGGLVALALATTYTEDADALVVSAPVARVLNTSALTLAVGKLLSRVAPDAGVLRPPLDKISRDPAVVDAYNHDPLVFRNKIRARLGAEIVATIAQVDAALPGLRLPLLVMQGSQDAVVDPSCGAHVYELAGSQDKTLKMYDGLWHEIFNEPERDTVIDGLIAWLDAHAISRAR